MGDPVEAIKEALLGAMAGDLGTGQEATGLGASTLSQSLKSADDLRAATGGDAAPSQVTAQSHDSQSKGSGRASAGSPAARRRARSSSRASDRSGVSDDEAGTAAGRRQSRRLRSTASGRGIGRLTRKDSKVSEFQDKLQEMRTRSRKGSLHREGTAAHDAPLVDLGGSQRAVEFSERVGSFADGEGGSFAHRTLQSGASHASHRRLATEASTEFLMRASSRRQPGRRGGGGRADGGYDDDVGLFGATSKSHPADDDDYGMDVVELTRLLDEKQEQLEACIAMGQNVVQNLGDLEEERDALHDAMEEQDAMFSEVTSECEALRAQNQALSQERDKMVAQMRDMRGTILELQRVLEQQQEEFTEREAEWDKEREEIEEREEQMKEDMRWQEEQAVAAYEAAENAKPDLERLSEVCFQFTTKAKRKYMFSVLMEWRNRRKKQRHALAILLHNARTITNWQSDRRTDALRKFDAWASVTAQQKERSQDKIYSQETEVRAEITSSSLRSAVRMVGSAWSVCGHNSQHWESVAKREGREMRRVKAKTATEASLLGAVARLEYSEQALRGTVTAAALDGAADCAAEALAAASAAWNGWQRRAASARRQLQRGTERAAEDATSQQQHAAGLEEEVVRLRGRCDHFASKARDADVRSDTIAAELQRLQAESEQVLAESSHVTRQLLAKDAELVRLRGQLTAYLARAQRPLSPGGASPPRRSQSPRLPSGELAEDAGLAAALRHAVALAAGLRQHAEETAALATRRVLSPRGAARKQGLQAVVA